MIINGKNNITTDYDLDFVRNAVFITITQIILQIHYNDTPIQTITINNPINSPTTNKVSPVILNTTNSGGNTFSASIYIGNLEINDIYLYTPPNIVYDINILVTTVLDTGSSDYDENAYFSNINYYAIYNPTKTNNVTSNCTASSNTTNDPIFTLNGKPPIQ